MATTGSGRYDRMAAWRFSVAFSLAIFSKRAFLRALLAYADLRLAIRLASLFFSLRRTLATRRLTVFGTGWLVSLRCLTCASVIFCKGMNQMSKGTWKNMRNQRIHQIKPYNTLHGISYRAVPNSNFSSAHQMAIATDHPQYDALQPQRLCSF